MKMRKQDFDIFDQEAIYTYLIKFLRPVLRISEIDKKYKT